MRLAFDLEQIGAWSFDFTTGQVQWDDLCGQFLGGIDRYSESS